MGALNSQEREETLDKLISDLAAHLPEDQLDSFHEFVYRYYSLDTHQDLVSGNWQELLGATHSFWKFIQYHNPDQPRIEVINPEYNMHGWHSTHTIIRILHRDMPFVVDSVRMKLNEYGSTIHLLRNGVLYSRRAEDMTLQFGMNPGRGSLLARRPLFILKLTVVRTRANWTS